MDHNLVATAIQTVRGCFSAVERRGSRQWASNAEPTYITGTQMVFRINSRTGTADYSLAKKNYPVLSELQMIGLVTQTIFMLISTALAECVRAPMDMRSTPVSAIARILAIVILPEASRRALPFVIFTASVISLADMLSSIITSAPASSAS